MAAPFLNKKLPYLCPGHDHRQRDSCYKAFIFIFTFVIYMTYRIAINPISVVKSVLYQKNCSDVPHSNTTKTLDPRWCDWAPFNKENAGDLLGALEMTHFSANVLALFLSGYIADRVNIRYFLTIGMIGSGIFTISFGLGYFYSIHTFVFYLAIHSLAGCFYATGYPCVMICMGNWFGKTSRGLITAVWHMNSNIGNILGVLIAGIFVGEAWGWSFVVPGIIITGMGVLVFLILVQNPENVECTKLDHSDNRELQNISSCNDREADSMAGETTSLRSGMLNQSNTIDKQHALSVTEVFLIPGLLEFSLGLFFVNIVWYSLLLWLPKYMTIKTTISPKDAAYTTTMFDTGGIIGGILAGYISDHHNIRGLTCVSFLITGAPLLFIYDTYGGDVSYTVNCLLLMLSGASIYGPNTVIATSVCLDLASHRSLRNNTQALGIVTAIIVGVGNVGSAVGPGLTGFISSYGWQNVFYMIIISDCLAVFSLSRVVYKEIRQIIHGCEDGVTTDTVLEPISTSEDIHEQTPEPTTSLEGNS